MDGFFARVMGVVAVLPGFGHATAPSWNGYVEDDYVYAAAPSAGTIARIPVKEGQLVRKGDVLFVLETSQQQAQYDAAKAPADAALADRTATAPEDGRIERLFFKAGEVAGAGVPVASLSGADAMKVLFYVNEADRQQIALGDVVDVSCEGCATGLTATISHFASDPQFTPPIIYSRDERNRLVFLTEATLVDQSGILPGQPVSIARTQSCLPRLSSM